MSPNQLLLKMKSDLKTIGKTQQSLNRYVLKAVLQVDVRVIEREPQEIETEEHPTVNVNNISQNEQVNIAGVNNITMSQLDLKYSLTSFHLVCRSTAINISNHERTHFVENIIPSLLALGKALDFIEFKWCESEFTSSRVLKQKANDYDLRSAPSKYIDALGTLTTQNNMELIIVEASSGQLKENTTHSIEDTLKILECGISSLRKEASHYNDASLSTFMKLKVFGVHVIKSQVTLSEISLDDSTHWKCIELRTAKLPTAWSDRVGLVQYMELLATLYVCILEMLDCFVWNSPIFICF
ncbi:hypothetical protein BDF20DRAFT_811162 [Mycotypha africana]|uniref:uncharacterized protein n=1 Tax=Mycotypha africana TaxID=64632 RepID=UPI002301BD04|nr:uncharacterized protein BDF20DRAFT_811162 [Mycotypha africana]KAI8992196.1 hypothetical protein BDF20DRAFT_811162 [Mycotypha africana]